MALAKQLIKMEISMKENTLKGCEKAKVFLHGTKATSFTSVNGQIISFMDKVNS